jgi:hypothetical protein
MTMPRLNYHFFCDTFSCSNNAKHLLHMMCVPQKRPHLLISRSNRRNLSIFVHAENHIQSVSSKFLFIIIIIITNPFMYLTSWQIVFYLSEISYLGPKVANVITLSKNFEIFLTKIL